MRHTITVLRWQDGTDYIKGRFDFATADEAFVQIDKVINYFDSDHFAYYSVDGRNVAIVHIFEKGRGKIERL